MSQVIRKLKVEVDVAFWWEINSLTHLALPGLIRS